MQRTFVCFFLGFCLVSFGLVGQLTAAEDLKQLTADLESTNSDTAWKAADSLTDMGPAAAPAVCAFAYELSFK